MKRDIKLTIGKLQEAIDSLKKYLNALEDIRDAEKRYAAILGDYKSEAVDAMKKEFDSLEEEMSSTEEAIKELHTILSDYIRDTGVYVKPLLADKAIRINRNMIWWNLGQIDKVVAHTFPFRERRQGDLVPFYLSGEERDEWKEKAEHNDQLVEDFRVNRFVTS